MGSINASANYDGKEFYKTTKLKWSVTHGIQISLPIMMTSIEVIPVFGYRHFENKVSTHQLVDPFIDLEIDPEQSGNNQIVANFPATYQRMYNFGKIFFQLAFTYNFR